MRDISTVISICGGGKCGLSAASSGRGGMDSMIFVPKWPFAVFCSGLGAPQASSALVLGRCPQLMASHGQLGHSHDIRTGFEFEALTGHQLAQQVPGAEDHAAVSSPVTTASAPDVRPPSKRNPSALSGAPAVAARLT